SAFGQKVNFGVISGATLTDDFRPTTLTFLNGVQHIANASQWFMIGPTVELILPKRFSAEVDAIHRRIRSSRLMVFSEPLPLPDGQAVTSAGPILTDGFSWQFTLLGKYRIRNRGARPFLEFGPSFLPQENRDQTGISAGSGVEMPIWRLNIAP